MQDKGSAIPVNRQGTQTRRWERRFQEGRTLEEALCALIRAQREGERS